MSKVENLPVEVHHACLRSVRRLHLTKVDYQREDVVLHTADVESAGKVRSTDVVRKIVEKQLRLLQVLERLEGERVEVLQAQLSRYLRGCLQFLTCREWLLNGRN